MITGHLATFTDMKFEIIIVSWLLFMLIKYSSSMILAIAIYFESILPAVDGESDDEFSTGAVVTISIVVTFIIITLIVTALITYIITSMYYRCRYELKKKDNDDDLTRHLIVMQANPAYVSSSQRVEVANYAYVPLSMQQTT